jgi:hypothetical protein
MHGRGGDDGPLASRRPTVLAGTATAGSTGTGAAAGTTGTTRTTRSASFTTFASFTGAASAWAAAATGTAAPTRPSAATRTAAWAIATVTTTAGPAVVPVISVLVTPSAALPRARGQDHRHVRCPLGCPDHLDTPGLLRRTGRLYLAERDHLDPLQPVLDLGPEHGTDFLARGDQGPLNDPLGLARASGAPRP